MILTRPEMAALCRTGAPTLQVPPGIDPVKLLWALAGNESSFGANAVPRHEQGYCRSGRYATALVEHRKRWGCWACCSYGPFQLTYLNAVTYYQADIAPTSLDTYGVIALQATLEFLKKYVLESRKAQTLEQIADTYNSGNWQDLRTAGVQRYVEDFLRNYDEPMP